MNRRGRHASAAGLAGGQRPARSAPCIPRWRSSPSPDPGPGLARTHVARTHVARHPRPGAGPIV